MKFLAGAVLTAVLLGAGPAFADRDHDHGRGHGHDKHYWKHQKHAYKHYGPPPHVVYRYHEPRVVHHYYEPVPVYYRPSPGIHVMLPNIYIPLR